MSPKALVARIDENTSVPLKIVGAVVMALVGLGWFVHLQLAAIYDAIADNRVQTARLEWKVDQIMQQRASGPRDSPSETFTRGAP